MTKLQKAVLVDLDDTVALNLNRGPFEWDKIYTDVLETRMYHILKALSDSGILVIFFTGRPPTAFEETDKWLENHFDFPWILYMRDKDDFRKSYISKKAMYEKYIQGKFDVLAVFDDHIGCARMYIELGLLCCNVGENSY